MYLIYKQDCKISISQFLIYKLNENVVGTRWTTNNKIGK